LKTLLLQLERQQWGVMEGWLAEPLLLALRKEALGLHVGHAFAPAGIGRGSAFAVDVSVRSDEVCWLDPENLTAIQVELNGQLELLRGILNRAFFLGLHDFESHLAIYEAGQHYDRHRDRFSDTDRRCVSFVLYLNPSWRSGDGGALRIYEGEHSQGIQTDVSPTWGKLLLFLSADIWHEVLPTHKQRLSFTGWFRTRV
jgi:SM-20-related protein